METATYTAPVDEVDLRDDGTIRLTVVGNDSRATVSTLRQIRLGEYRVMRAGLDTIRTEDDAAAWFSQAVGLLADLPVPAIPSWVASPSLPARWVDHWRSVPLGPWEPAEDEGPVDPRRPRRRPDVMLVQGVFAELAPIYEALANRNIHTVAADQMEMWQIASVFGMWEPAEQREVRRDAEQRDAERNRKMGRTRAGTRPGAPRSRGGSVRNPLAERIAYAKGEGPKPEWRPEDAFDNTELMTTLNRG